MTYYEQCYYLIKTFSKMSFKENKNQELLFPTAASH